MIGRAQLIRIDRPATHGRTGPILAACEFADEDGIEVFVKLSAGCDQGVTNLAREVVGACLAADLGLPVPKPWLVEIPPDIISNDPTIAEKLRCSNPVAFGSTRSVGFSAWTPGQRLTQSMIPTAAGILLFDGIIQNSDRRLGNPNCLVRGDDIRIIDHELAFAHKLILSWKAPWVLGGMNHLETPERHIFVDPLRTMQPDLQTIRERWDGLSDDRLREYEFTVPAEWDEARSDVNAALDLITDARHNIGLCISELERILS